MATRFRRDRGDTTPEGDGGGTATAVRTPERTATRSAMPTAAVARERGREEFGGISWGATLLGYLSSFGLAALLVALLGAAGAAIGFTKIADAAGSTSDETIGFGGAIG